MLSIDKYAHHDIYNDDIVSYNYDGIILHLRMHKFNEKYPYYYRWVLMYPNDTRFYEILSDLLNYHKYKTIEYFYEIVSPDVREKLYESHGFVGFAYSPFDDKPFVIFNDYYFSLSSSPLFAKSQFVEWSKFKN